MLCKPNVQDDCAECAEPGNLREYSLWKPSCGLLEVNPLSLCQ